MATSRQAHLQPSSMVDASLLIDQKRVANHRTLANNLYTCKAAALETGQAQLEAHDNRAVAHHSCQAQTLSTRTRHGRNRGNQERTAAADQIYGKE
jgi:hypothetical protein